MSSGGKRQEADEQRQGQNGRSGAPGQEPGGGEHAPVLRDAAIDSLAMIGRRAMWLHGRRAAWLSALGFAIVLLSFLPINYFLTTSHSF